MADDIVKSILTEVKASIGFGESISIEDTSFDNELITFIDGQLSVLWQKGVGTAYPNRLICKRNLTWDEFFEDAVHDRGNAIMYVILKTRLLFDPPLPATITAMTEAAKEALYRAGLEFEIL